MPPPTAGRVPLTYSTNSPRVSVNTTTGAFTDTPIPAQRLSAIASTTATFTITASNGVNTATQTVTVAVAPY